MTKRVMFAKTDNKTSECSRWIAFSTSLSDKNVRPTRAEFAERDNTSKSGQKKLRPVWIPCRTSLPRAKPRGMSDPHEPRFAERDNTSKSGQKKPGRCGFLVGQACPERSREECPTQTSR